MQNMDVRSLIMIVSLFGMMAAVFWMRGSRKSSEYAMSFHKKKDYRTETGRFDRVAANPEAKRSLEGLARYMKEPEKYEKMGARMPRGVLLYGPPGTGKTLMARALAGEAGVPFFALSGSDFVEMYAGVGASRVRSLFQKAHKAGRAVIFIDEIDSLGKKRGGEMADERDQTLNALLAEMSAIRSEEKILVVAATNRAESLDPALLRPGRFDRRIEVGLPDQAQRLAILQLHAENKPMEETVDLARLAADTVRFSGAALESLLNEAAIQAAEMGRERISSEDVRHAYCEAVAGADRKEARFSRKELERVAAHEAGHALAARLRTNDKRILRVSILPTTRGAAGYNLAIGEETHLWTKDRFLAELDVLLAGRAAEEALFGECEISSGASDDLARAAEMTTSMIVDLALDGEKAVHLRALGRQLNAPMEGAFARSRRLLEERYAETLCLLKNHAQTLRRLTDCLLDKESLSGEEVEACLQKEETA